MLPTTAATAGEWSFLARGAGNPGADALFNTGTNLTFNPVTDATTSASSIQHGGAPELSPQGLSEELLDNQDIETGYSMRETLRLVLAACAGKVSGGGTATVTIRSVTDGTNRIVASVDVNGNRTATTYDVADE